MKIITHNGKALTNNNNALYINESTQPQLITLTNIHHSISNVFGIASTAIKDIQITNNLNTQTLWTTSIELNT